VLDIKYCAPNKYIYQFGSRFRYYRACFISGNIALVFFLKIYDEGGIEIINDLPPVL
jgi:hypothetical protein